MNKILLLLAALTLAACSSKTNNLPRQAPADIAQSFSVIPKKAVVETLPGEEAPQGNFLKVQKASLGKIFLMVSSGKTGGTTPQWMDLKPQVVSFEKDFSGKKLALMSENYNSVYSEIQSDDLVQTFDIVAEDDKTITFDWGSGLHSFVLEGVFDTDVADPSETASDDDASKQVIPVVDAYVKSLGVDQNNNLEINQISKVRSNAIKSSDGNPDFQTREETLTMNVQIRPYTPPNADFNPKLADPSRRVGFFVTKRKKPQYSTGDQNFITKWDLDPAKGPITFLISDAVPAQYVQAASEGALYWNKVFGREVVVVKTHVDPQANPQNRTIMVRWISWMDSGAAYAQAQADPLTGEILRGQIFMPAVFTRVGSADLLGLNGGNPVNKPVLNGATACDISKKLMAVNALALEANDSQRLRLAQDSVRSTVAHEAGHALGLRHNFAGSYSAKVSTADIYKSAATYLKDPAHPGLEGTTSIMDYVSGYDDVLTAAYIKHDGLSYDKMAMKWAYAKDDANILDEKVSKYCSDEDIGFANAKDLQIYGCERFDAGNNPLYRKYLETKDGKDTNVKVLFVSIMGRLYPGDSADRADIDEVIKGTYQWAAVTTSSLKYVGQALMSLNKDGAKASTFISLENAKAHVGKDYATQDPELQAEVAADLKAAGGYPALLNGLLRDEKGQIDMNWMDRQIENLKQSPAFSQGRTLSARDYTLSADDQQKILSFFTDVVAPANKKSIFYGAAQMLPAVDTDSKAFLSLRSDLISTADAQQLALLVRDLNMAADQTKAVHVGVGGATQVAVPVKFYNAVERVYSLNLLSAQLLNLNDNKASHDLVAQSLRDQMDKVILAADPAAILSGTSKEDYLKVIASLESRHLLDGDATAWLENEWTVYNQL